MDNFFGRSGTMNQAMNLASDIRGFQSSNSIDRLGALGRIVSIVMSLFA